MGTTSSNKHFNYFLLPYFKKYQNLRYLAIENNLAPGFELVNSICNESNECSSFEDRGGTKCPFGCKCTFKRYMMVFNIICSKPKAVTALKKLPRAYVGKTSLYLENLNLTNLPTTSLIGYSNINKLYVSGNQLEDLAIWNLPENLTFLDIRNNRFKYLRPEVLDYLEQQSHNLRILISNNSWSCDCFPSSFLQFIQRVPEMIDDLGSIKCDGLTPSIKLDKCRVYTIYLILFVAALIVVACVILFWYRTSILMCLYYHNILPNCILSKAENIEFPQRYDAFLAFSHKNLDLINEYVERLENGRRQFRLCFYQRDWLVGESIPKAILQTIENSKRIILLMTKEFVSSSWGIFEFRTAIKATSMDRRKRLIVIVYPGVEDFSELDSELRLYMKFNTYLRYDDSQFWKKLIYAMPHIKVGNPKKKVNRNEDPDMVTDCHISDVE